jgi:hypothetical protein
MDVQSMTSSPIQFTGGGVTFKRQFHHAFKVFKDGDGRRISINI